MPTLIEVEADVEDIADPRGFVPIPVGNVTTYAESSVGLSLVSAALRLIDKNGIEAVLADLRARGQA